MKPTVDLFKLNNPQVVLPPEKERNAPTMILLLFLVLAFFSPVLIPLTTKSVVTEVKTEVAAVLHDVGAGLTQVAGF